MENKRKIAIVTLYDNYNLGNRLQNYAVQELLRRYASDVVTFGYKELPLIGWKAKLAMFLHVPGKAIDQKRKQKERYSRFRAFTERYIKTEPECSFADRVNHAVATDADVVVVGSDQVWHNWRNSEEELSYFFLEFVPEKKRVCLAPSFGFDSFSEEKKDHYVRGLQGFRHLSCREQSGCDLIKAETGRDATLLIDPTMLLTTAEWDVIAKKPEYPVPERFLLLYFLGEKSPEAKEAISRFAAENALTVIDIFDKDALEYYATAPDEFVYLIKNATMICTDSFHGCVFSILYKKEFRYFSRSGAMGAQMSNRQKTLLQKFGIFKEAGVCDYSAVEAILEDERNKAKAYLENALSDTE